VYVFAEEAGPLTVKNALFVPPFATANNPEDTFDAFRDVMFAPEKAAVVDPVPPEATGSAVARVRLRK
jgi:hypothetical protein